MRSKQFIHIHETEDIKRTCRLCQLGFKGVNRFNQVCIIDLIPKVKFKK